MIRHKRTQAVYRWHAIDERVISPMNTQGTRVFQPNQIEVNWLLCTAEDD
jgi:hypothetical protein|tara:strand:+ start:278 stop:427 length:150 start_codon:yes stop_codon:yes gene_type:complete